MRKVICVLLLIILIAGCTGKSRRIVTTEDDNPTIENMTNYSNSTENETGYTNESVGGSTENNIDIDEIKGSSIVNDSPDIELDFPHIYGINELLNVEKLNKIESINNLEDIKRIDYDQMEEQIINETMLQSKNKSSVILQRDMVVREGKDVSGGEHTWTIHEYFNFSGMALTKDNLHYKLNNTEVEWSIKKQYSFINRPSRKVEEWCFSDRVIDQKGKTKVDVNNVRYDNDSLYAFFSVPVEFDLKDRCNGEEKNGTAYLRYEFEIPINSSDGEVRKYNWGRAVKSGEELDFDDKPLAYDSKETRVPKEDNPMWIIKWNLEYFN